MYLNIPVNLLELYFFNIYPVITQNTFMWWKIAIEEIGKEANNQMREQKMFQSDNGVRNRCERHFGNGIDRIWQVIGIQSKGERGGKKSDSKLLSLSEW